MASGESWLLVPYWHERSLHSVSIDYRIDDRSHYSHYANINGYYSLCVSVLQLIIGFKSWQHVDGMYNSTKFQFTRRVLGTLKGYSREGSVVVWSSPQEFKLGQLLARYVFDMITMWEGNSDCQRWWIEKFFLNCARIEYLAGFNVCGAGYLAFPSASDMQL